jgi:hypothetical protein
MVTDGSHESDPILVKRARYQRLADLGQRIGYLLIVVAVVAFVAGSATGFPPLAVGATIGGLIGACVVLPPAIIAGFAVKAAEREDRELGGKPGQTGKPGQNDTMR